MKLPYKEFQKRERNDPSFAELVDFGRLCRKAYWLEIGRKAARNGAASQAFNFWHAFMKNEFGWSDKVETKDVTELANTPTDELKSRIAALTNKLKGVPSPVEMANLIDGTIQ